MNRLENETSPYLLQHANNPVDWYPWGAEAFERAKAEDKPIFLSVGYSTCHWCHVMAHESFEDADIANLLNKNFVCVKVDKEERPDIDSIYMDVCMSVTGSGGWPMTIIMDHAGKPFFAGTYFPKRQRYGMRGLTEILEAVAAQWQKDRSGLLVSAEAVTVHINARHDLSAKEIPEPEKLIRQAVGSFEASFDGKYGGFGRAPKFPSPHNLLFLMEVYQTNGDQNCLKMAELTLQQMAKGGTFDHIGFGFSRYSTDEKWLAPHFEKMLYDNALLIMAYSKAYTLAKEQTYQYIAEKTIEYIHREMTNPQGGFYSAQDADSDGVEGKYYVFTPDEITAVLGETDGKAFCGIYDITASGNFEGKSIPNQIALKTFDSRMEALFPKLYEYRKSRTTLHKDDKILTSWNGLMIAALVDAFFAFNQDEYLQRAIKAAEFIETNLSDGQRVFTSFRDGKRSGNGFIDDYSFFILALLRLYDATLDKVWLHKAEAFAKEAIDGFFDYGQGGFYLYGNQDEELIARPKETYDGAIPSGNSVMTYNLIKLSLLTNKPEFETVLDLQTRFMNTRVVASGGNSFYLLALLKKEFPDRKITVVLSDPADMQRVKQDVTGRGVVLIHEREMEEYRLLNGKTTYYICDNNVCLPPSNTFTI